jgi:hypothetical protein
VFGLAVPFHPHVTWGGGYDGVRKGRAPFRTFSNYKFVWVSAFRNAWASLRKRAAWWEVNAKAAGSVGATPSVTHDQKPGNYQSESLWDGRSMKNNDDRANTLKPGLMLFLMDRAEYANGSCLGHVNLILETLSPA